LFTTQRVYIEDQTAVWSTVEHCQSVKQLAPLPLPLLLLLLLLVEHPG